MSLAQEHYSTTSSTRPVSRRRLLFPVVVLCICAVLYAVPFVWDALGNDANMNVSMLIWWAPLTAVVSLTLWWLFFSGFSWTTRIFVLVALAVGAGSFIFFGIRKVEMETTAIALVPRIQFAWDPEPEEALADYLKEHSAKAGGPADFDATVGPEDFPFYRGVNRDGVVPFGELSQDWGKNPPKVLWRHPCGGGYSGIAVAGNIAVTHEQRGGKEVVACYDRDTGAPRWSYAYDAYRMDLMGEGPRATPAIHNQRIFALGATGEFVCLNVKGERQWSINILADSKAVNIKWGLTGSPLIFDDLVVVHAGIDPKAPAGAAVVAFEQATGKKRWSTGNRVAGYSSPQLATIGGVRQILLFDGEGLVAYDPKTGKELWGRPWITDYEMNSIQPVVFSDNRVFISSELKNGCAMLRVNPPKDNANPWTVEEVWHNKNLAARFANPVTDGKHIYALHNLAGVLKCLDAETGKVLWSGERYGPGQMLLDKQTLIIVSGDKGAVSLVAADPQAYRELDRLEVFNHKTWNTPALAGDRLFMRNQTEIACLKLARK